MFGCQDQPIWGGPSGSLHRILKSAYFNTDLILVLLQLQCCSPDCYLVFFDFAKALLKTDK